MNAQILAFIGSLGQQELLILFIIGSVIIWPFWRICEKAGYPGALAIIVIVPVFNLILFYALAFLNWPIENRLKQLQFENKNLRED